MARTGCSALAVSVSALASNAIEVRKTTEPARSAPVTISADTAMVVMEVAATIDLSMRFPINCAGTIAMTS